MYDEILFPTDGSEAADVALGHAIDLAEQYGARIHALFVVNNAPYAGLDVGAGPIIEALKTDGERVTEAVEAAGAEVGVDVVSTVTLGSPHRRIVEYAADNDVDLIVMATHGRTGLDRYLLGSVTERVVRSAGCPVLTINTGGVDGDGTDTGTEAVEEASGAADADGGSDTDDESGPPPGPTMTG